MHPANEKTSGPLRTVALGAPVLVLLLGVLVFVQRSRYPEGTFLHQQRTYFAERLNPDVAEVVTALVPGETTVAELTKKLGEPTAKVEKDGLELWVYTMRIAKVTERRLLGLAPTGESTDAVESQMPVGVKDGVVVHTYVNPSQDPAVKAAVESMWDEYTSGG